MLTPVHKHLRTRSPNLLLPELPEQVHLAITSQTYREHQSESTKNWGLLGTRDQAQVTFLCVHLAPVFTPAPQIVNCIASSLDPSFSDEHSEIHSVRVRREQFKQLGEHLSLSLSSESGASIAKDIMTIGIMQILIQDVRHVR